MPRCAAMVAMSAFTFGQYLSATLAIRRMSFNVFAVLGLPCGYPMIFPFVVMRAQLSGVLDA